MERPTSGYVPGSPASAPNLEHAMEVNRWERAKLITILERAVGQNIIERSQLLTTASGKVPDSATDLGDVENSLDARLEARLSLDKELLHTNDSGPGSVEFSLRDAGQAVQRMNALTAPMQRKRTASEVKGLKFAGVREKRVYLCVRVMYIGNLVMSDQLFHTRFDIHVLWDPADAPSPDFDPIIRFPEAQMWEEVMRVNVVGDDAELGLVGFRQTIAGVFRSSLDLRTFPFDIQDLKIEAMLGRCRSSGMQLRVEDGWMLEHHPTRPNLLIDQYDNCWTYHPLKYSLSKTGWMEDSDTQAKYTIHVQIDRDSRFYIRNHFVMVFGICILSTFIPFSLKVSDMPDRAMVEVTLYLVLVAYKFAISQDLPVLPYETMFDQYLFFAFKYMILVMACDLGVYYFYYRDEVEGYGEQGSHGEMSGPHEDADGPKAYRAAWYSLVTMLTTWHIFFIFRVYQHTRRVRTDEGQMDKNLVKLLKENKITLNEEETRVADADLDKYKRLLETVTTTRIVHKASRKFKQSIINKRQASVVPDDGHADTDTARDALPGSASPEEAPSSPGTLITGSSSKDSKEAVSPRSDDIIADIDACKMRKHGASGSDTAVPFGLTLEELNGSEGEPFNSVGKPA